MVYSSTVMSNHAHISGGGIYNKSGWTYLQDSTVLNNVVHQGAGGGIYIYAGIVDIAYSTISGLVPVLLTGVGSTFSTAPSAAIHSRTGVRIAPPAPTRAAYSTQETVRYG
jgi:hypothetical protein